MEENGNHLDDLLRAAFEDEAKEGESVLESIERRSGAKARVLLRDAPEHETPVLHMPADADVERPKGDRRYQVLGEIARGGIGVIVKGRDRNLGRSVALKVLRKEYANNDEVLRRFIEEAQIGGQLQHPGIVPVYGLGISGEDRPYFAMKFVKGETLSALLEDRRDVATDRRKYLGIFEQIAQTVAYAHARGVVHRDLKPSNVMVGTFGEVLVVDWGLAKVLGRPEPETPQATIISTVRTEGEGSASLVGSVMGTPAYMPPEQALGQVEDLDERSDVFSLGAILTEILTGAPPYEGDTKDQIVQAAQARLDDAMDRLDNSGADPEVVALTKRCLEAVPKDRPRDAGVVAREIAEHLAEAEARALRAEVEAAEERAKAEEEREKEAKERHRVKQERAARRRTLAIAAAVLLLVAAGGVGYFLKDRSDRQRAEAARTAVTQAMREATLLYGAQDWDRALAAARKAVALAETRGADEQTTGKVQALLARVTEEKRVADEYARLVAEDAEFLAELDDVRLRRGDEFRSTETDAAYAESFRKHGIDVLELPPEESAARIRERTRPGQIAAALDDWASLCTYENDLPSDRAARLYSITRIADPDEWRVRLRDASLSMDAAALLALAREANSSALPPRTIDMLGRRLGTVDVSEASAFLRKAQHHHPDDVWINYNLALQLEHSDPPDWDGAIRYLTAALAVYPEGPRLWSALATCHMRAGRLEEALRIFERAQEVEPVLPQTLNNHGATLVRLDRMKEGMGLFQRALVLDPDLWEAHANIASLHWHKGNIALAEESHRAVLRLDPENASAHAGLGYALLRQGGGEEALPHIERAIALDPSNPRFHFYLGAAYQALDDHEKAVDAFEQCILHGPQIAQAHNQLALSLWEVGKQEEAIAMARKAQRLDPKLIQPRLNLGNFLWRQDNLEGAEDEYLGALRVDDRCVPAYTRLGDLYFEQKRYERALPKYLSARKLAPENGRIRMCIAACYSRTDREAEAILEARESLRLGYRAAPVDLAHMLANSRDRSQGALEEALRLALEGARKCPDLLLARIVLGIVRYRCGQFEEARGELERAIEDSTDKRRPHAETFLAMSQWQIRREEEARATLRGVLTWCESNDCDFEEDLAEAKALILGEGR